MKRARVLFTEEYNCQKNKRSQSLFARASLSLSLSLFLAFHPRPILSLYPLSLFARNLFTLLFLCVTAATDFVSLPPSVLLLQPFFTTSSSLRAPSPRRWLPSSAPRTPPTPGSLYCDLVEKLTRLAGQRIRNYDLSRRRDYLLSRRLWNPGRYSCLCCNQPSASYALFIFASSTSTPLRAPFFLHFLAFAHDDAGLLLLVFPVFPSAVDFSRELSLWLPTTLSLESSSSLTTFG